jgi:hypothetical protein
MTMGACSYRDTRVSFSYTKSRKKGAECQSGDGKESGLSHEMNSHKENESIIRITQPEIDLTNHTHPHTHIFN